MGKYVECPKGLKRQEKQGCLKASEIRKSPGIQEAPEIQAVSSSPSSSPGIQETPEIQEASGRSGNPAAAGPVPRGISWEEARALACAAAVPVSKERVPLAQCFGRVLAEELRAASDVPPFDRSPYDGYAFRAADTEAASGEHPVTLRILEEIPAGGVPHVTVTEGTAVKLLTGAPIPPGADAVRMYEKTECTEEEVKLFSPAKTGENIIRAGEDVLAGTLLAAPGEVIDAGLLGSLAAQNVSMPLVFRRPLAALLSTGSELQEVGETLREGCIYNTNRYTIGAALAGCGCDVRYLGIAGDDPEKLLEYIREGISQCDALVLTGGVSAGDYDYTRRAMEAAGAEILFDGVGMKPGMACVYGTLGGKLIAGLSGNPASSLTNFHAVAAPAFRKLAGRQHYLPEELKVTLLDGFSKKSGGTRFLRGRLSLQDGTVGMRLSRDQGNVILRSVIGNDVMAVVPAGSGPLDKGTELTGFRI